MSSAAAPTSPQENANYSAEGLASWYGEDFHGRATANGEVYDMTSISAAHPTLPIPSYARVTNLANQKSIIVRVNDRGPYHANRVIDVSVRTAKLLGFYDHGVTRVRVEYVGRAALEGSDDTKLAATLRSGTPAPGPSEVRVASSRPFLPQSAEPVRGAVPVPADRPFELGHDETAGRVAKRAVRERGRGRQPSADRAREPASATSGRQPKAAVEISGQARGAGRMGAAASPPVSRPPAACRRRPRRPRRYRLLPVPAPGNGAVMSGRGLY